jgi:hypothetical protein
MDCKSQGDKTQIKVEETAPFSAVPPFIDFHPARKTNRKRTPMPPDFCAGTPIS